MERLRRKIVNFKTAGLHKRAEAQINFPNSPTADLQRKQRNEGALSTSILNHSKCDFEGKEGKKIYSLTTSHFVLNGTSVVLYEVLNLILLFSFLLTSH
jgi:hypothetical protein